MTRSAHAPENAHLSEEERQRAADGSLAAGHLAAVEAHLARCGDCAADVSRLRMLMTRIRDAADSAGSSGVAEELWPSIRSRIDATKIVPLGAPVERAVPRDAHRWWAAAGLVAAALVVAIVLRLRGGSPIVTAGSSAPGARSTDITAIADSVRGYEQEAKALLDELEMQRAMRRPTDSSSVDRDLRTIDQAIAELQDAIAHDPNNPALRRLLASSYRQKVELLKRANHAG